MADDRATRLKRLKFRAWRRGFKEADLILGGFADLHLETLPDSALDEFEALLAQPDQDIYDWLLGRADVPPEFDNELFARLRALDFVAARIAENAAS